MKKDYQALLEALIKEGIQDDSAGFMTDLTMAIPVAIFELCKKNSKDGLVSLDAMMYVFEQLGGMTGAVILNRFADAEEDAMEGDNRGN